MSNHLKLFNELSTHAKFRFETPDSGKVFIKTSETGAHHDGAYQKINPGTLVFPVVGHTKITTPDGREHTAIPLDSGRWFLTYEYEVDSQKPTFFNSLDDIIAYLWN